MRKSWMTDVRSLMSDYSPSWLSLLIDSLATAIGEECFSLEGDKRVNNRQKSPNYLLMLKLDKLSRLVCLNQTNREGYMLKSSTSCAETMENPLKIGGNILRKFGIFLLLIIISFTTQAQNLKVSVNVDSILIGDIYTLEMSVENSGNSNVFFPVFTDTIGNGKIEIIEDFPIDTLENKLSKKWDLSIYYPGAYQVAGFSAIVQNENGSVDTLKSFDPVTVFVKTMAVDTSKAFKPIKAPKPIPYPFKEVVKKYLPYVLGLIALMALLFFLGYKYKNRDKPKYVKPKTALDFHKEAIDKLKEIDRQKMWQSGQIKEYYLEISEVLRTYIEGRYDFNAMESTTDEIIEELKNSGENKALGKKLKEVLQQCDLAKFAKFQPLGDENMRMMKISQDFVAHTKPKEAEQAINNEKNISSNE